MADAKIVITAETSQAERALGSLGDSAKIATAALGAIGAALSVKALTDYTTRWTDLNSRLKNATGSSEAAQQAMASIEATARRTYSSLENTADVFIRNSMAMNELGYTTNEQIKLSEALNNAIVVSGAKGEQAARAMDAFAKSVARGKIDGEAFNSIVESSPRVIQAMADGLGVTTAELRQMVTDGKLVTDTFVPALITQMQKLGEEADAMPATISDAFVLLENSLVSTIGKMDEALGISRAVANGFIFLADHTGVLVGGVAGLGVALVALAVKIYGVNTALIALRTTLVSTGIGAAIVALGLGLGYAAEKMGVFGDAQKENADDAKKIADEEKRRIEDLAAAEERKVKRAQEALKVQKDGLADYIAELEYKQQGIGLSAEEEAIRNAIHGAAQKLKITDSEIAASLRSRLTTLAQQTVERERQNNITKTALQLQQQIELQTLALSIENSNQREIAIALRQKEYEIGRNLTVEERDQLTKLYETNQALKQQAEIRDLINQHLGKTTTLTDQIKQGLDLINNANPLAQAEENYKQSLENLEAAHKAAKEAGIDIESDYLLAVETLHQDHATKLEQLAQDQLNKDLERIQKRLMAEKNLTNAVLSEKEKQTLQAIGEQERQQRRVNTRIEFEKKSEEEKAAWVIEQSADMFNALGAHNKKAFEAAKALNIAKAIMNTWLAASEAFATFGGWPFGAIAAAATVAMGMAQVNAIRSQQYSGRALGGPVVGGQEYMVGERGPEVFRPSSAGTIIPNDKMGGQPVTVNFNITANDTTGFDELITSRRQLITGIIRDAQLETGRRF